MYHEGSLYTAKIRDYLHTRDWPLTFRYMIVELDEPPCLKIRLYRQNINALDSDAKLQLASILGEALRKINDSGVPMYTWVVPGDGRHDCFYDEDCTFEGCPYV